MQSLERTSPTEASTSIAREGGGEGFGRRRRRRPEEAPLASASAAVASSISSPSSSSPSSSAFSKIFRATAAAVCRHLVKGETTSLVTPRDAAKSPRDDACFFFFFPLRVRKSRERQK